MSWSPTSSRTSSPSRRRCSHLYTVTSLPTMLPSEYSTPLTLSVSRSLWHLPPTKAAPLSTSFSLGLSDDLVRSTSVLEFFSDHRSVLVSLTCRASRFPSKKISYRRLLSIEPEDFAADINRLSLLTNPSDNLDGLVEQYNCDLRVLIDKHAPLVTKTVILRPSAPCISDDTLQSKRDMTQVR